MKCAICGREFKERHPKHKYCSVECAKVGYNQTRAARYAKREWFKTEWAAWKRDFARGLTESNSEAR